MGHIRKLIVAFALMAGLVPAFAQAPPPVPALPDTERRTSYNISASTCACAVGFQLYGDSTDYVNWLEVWINGKQVLATDPVQGWAVTSPTGSLATIPRPIADAVLTFTTAQTGVVQIVGARRPRRASQFSENRGVAARDVNQVVTDIVAMLREVWDKINDVTGRVVMAPPGEVFTPLPPAANRAGLILCFDSSGNPKVCAPLASGSISAGANITLTGANPTVIDVKAGAANTFKGSLNGSMTSDIALTACTLSYQITKWVAGTGWQCGLNPVLPSRAIAATLNLAAFTAITTQGYAQPGDGGGATFHNSTTSPFVDSQVSTGTLTVNGTSGCTTGTYPGVGPSGGTGHGLQITYVVSGGVVTSATIVGNGGNAYSVGDVVTTTITGCAASVTYTITGITTATCSFTETSGAHFQMIVDASGIINVKQCGAAVNWTSTAGDAGSTNDTTAIQNALNFAGNTVQPTVDGGGVAGQMVLVPFGNTLSGALTVPFGVRFTGVNAWSSQIKFTDAMGSGIIPVTLCDSSTHLACFGTQLANMTLRGGSGAANSNVPMVFSNNVQQMNVLWRVAFYPGQRGCVQYDSGFGGAAQVGFVEVECTMSSIASPGFNFTNIGTTLIYLKNANAEFGGSGVTANGVQALGGFIDIDNFHTEGVSTGIFWNNTGGTVAGALRVHNVSGGSHCTNLVLKQSGSTASDVVVGMAVPNGCTNTVTNGGTLVTGTLVADTLY